MKTLLLIATAAAATFSLSAQAGQSTLSEFRGYEACLSANADNFQGLSTERSYLMTNTAAGRTYYINATAWENGQRVQIGFSCQTTDSGQLIRNEGVSYSHFVSDSESRVQVAGN